MAAALRARVPALLAALLLLAAPSALGDFLVEMRGPLHANAAAIAETGDGRIVGVLADLYVTASVAPDGAGGGVFLDTRPLMQLDMQGSARMAVRVASGLAGVSPSSHDVFFAVRSESPLIGGPSAGALLAVMAVAAMTNHTVRDDAVLTGAVLPDGSVGPVGGVWEKAGAASRAGKALFLYPATQEVVPLSGGDAVDMPARCREALALTCRGVLSVEEAFAQMTGFSIVRTPPPGANATPERSSAVLRLAADGLLANAERLHAGAAAAWSGRSVPADLAALVQSTEARATAALASARAATNRSEYYTTASKSFQTALESRALSHYAAWDARARDPAYLAEATASTRAAVDAAVADAEAGSASNVAQLQALGAAQTRAREAQSLLAEAIAAGSPTETLRLLAFATERASTVGWWLAIGDEFDDGREVVPERVAEAAAQAIEAASDSVAYARVLLGAAGASAPSQLDTLLRRARDDAERGFAASALFTALEADVRAGLLFAVGSGGVHGSALDHGRDLAYAAIQSSRLAGTEPILAVSYVEFANSLRNETPPSVEEAYVFYQLARSAGRLPDALSLDARTGGATRFAPFPNDVPRLQVPASWMPAYLAIGVGLGAASALLLLAGGRREET